MERDASEGWVHINVGSVDFIPTTPRSQWKKSSRRKARYDTCFEKIIVAVGLKIEESREAGASAGSPVKRLLLCP